MIVNRPPCARQRGAGAMFARAIRVNLIINLTVYNYAVRLRVPIVKTACRYSVRVGDIDDRPLLPIFRMYGNETTLPKTGTIDQLTHVLGSLLSSMMREFVNFVNVILHLLHIYVANTRPFFTMPEDVLSVTSVP